MNEPLASRSSDMTGMADTGGGIRPGMRTGFLWLRGACVNDPLGLPAESMEGGSRRGKSGLHCPSQQSQGLVKASVGRRGEAMHERRRVAELCRWIRRGEDAGFHARRMGRHGCQGGGSLGYKNRLMLDSSRAWGGRRMKR